MVIILCKYWDHSKPGKYLSFKLYIIIQGYILRKILGGGGLAAWKRSFLGKYLYVVERSIYPCYQNISDDRIRKYDVNSLIFLINSNFLHNNFLLHNE